MSQLLSLSERCWYFPGAVNVGVVATGDGTCVLIDSGADKDHAKKILKATLQAGLAIKAIINTHSHADHYGGNAFLQNKLGIPAYAPVLEEAIMRYPILEPMYLYAGARPPKELQSKWLMGDASHAEILAEPGHKNIGGMNFELMDVSGHASKMFAVRVDDVLFATDAVFGQALLQKYPLQFAVDISRQLQSVRVVQTSGARLVLPGHGEPTEKILELCQGNISAIDNATAAVLAACGAGGTLPEVLAGVCKKLGIQMNDMARYHLNQTTVLAHLTALLERGLVRYEITDNLLVWQSV